MFLSRSPNVNEKQKSKAYRQADPRFVSLGSGKFGGFKPGVSNGPKPRTERGKRRQASGKRSRFSFWLGSGKPDLGFCGSI
jgi:hypothetical protein